MEKLLLSRKEAIKLLGISETMFYRLSKTKGFPIVRIGRRRLVDAKGLEAWVAAQQREDPQEAR